jgi:hypothetical protein
MKSKKEEKGTAAMIKALAFIIEGIITGAHTGGSGIEYFARFVLDAVSPWEDTKTFKGSPFVPNAGRFFSLKPFLGAGTYRKLCEVIKNET